MRVQTIFSEQNHRKLSFLMALILTILLAKQVAVFLWSFAPNTDYTLTNSTGKQNKTTNANQNKLDFNIFGVTIKTKPAIATAKKPAKAPVTKLNLTLKGIIAATPMKKSMAIVISGNTNQELVYSVGDILPGNVKLYEVYADRIIIDRQGIKETLYLPSYNTVAINTKKKPVVKLTEKKVLSMTPKDLRKELMKKPEDITKYAVASPQFHKGKLLGYKIKMKKYQTLLEQQGLTKNDIITSINGIKLSNQKNGLKILSQLTNAAVLNLTIKRGDSVENVSISFQ
ncbi:MAG: type II secretion system protein GspC [Gammaproteobacteria bacterium]|nr:MAG: type II secretion system protein GspC [Gammaproteobacteria bacterium]